MVPIPAVACLSRSYQLDPPLPPVQAQGQSFTTLTLDAEMTKGFDVSCDNPTTGPYHGIWAPTGRWLRAVPTSVIRTSMRLMVPGSSTSIGDPARRMAIFWRGSGWGPRTGTASTRLTFYLTSTTNALCVSTPTPSHIPMCDAC